MTQPNIASPRRTATLEIGGQDVVLAYADERAEYDALRTGAVVVDRSHRGRLRVFGEKSGEALTGLVTNDVLAMLPGSGRYAAALSSKGRIVADVRIFAGVASYLVDTSARAWPGLLSMVKKYVNPRVSGYRDDSHAIRDVGVFGVDARRIVSGITGVSGDILGALAPYGHVDVQVEGTSVTIARAPDIAIEGYELFVPYEIFDRVWEQAVDSGATPAGLGAWEIARVEAGRVEWGIDIDDSTIPQEAGLEVDAVSFTKGCFIGQELVCRIDSRGHVNRFLRRLSLPGTTVPPPGAEVARDDKVVGTVTSATAVPGEDRVVALAMVRREVEPPAEVTVRWDAADAPAVVLA